MIHTGFDTETARGKAVVLATPRRSLVNPKSFATVAAWLWADENPSYLAWNADYDIQAILRFLPTAALEILGLTTRITYRGIKLRYVPGKYLEIRGSDPRTRKPALARVCDLMTFYGGGLERAAVRFLGPDRVKLLPEWMEEYRNTGRMDLAVKIDRQAVIDYCVADAALVEDLGEKMGEAVERIGLKFDRPVSPAALARQYWGSKLVGREPRRLSIPYREAYRGGRMEVTRRGMISGVQSWDIHSAYPSVLANYPAPKDCVSIDTEKDLRPDATFAVAWCDIKLPAGARAYPIAAMTPGGMLFYPWGYWSAWLDAETIRVTRRLFGDSSVIVRAICQHVQTSDSRPFAKMAELFEARKDPTLKLAVKLVTNSTYGLLAETLGGWRPAKRITTQVHWAGGGAWERVTRSGRGANLILAAHITAKIRARIIEETWDSGVYSYATDGVLCESPPQGPQGAALGDWGHDGSGDALIVGSGLYATDFGKGWVTKTRGFRHLPPLPDLLGKDKRLTRIRITQLRAASLRQMALGRASREEMNDLISRRKVLSVNFDSKREGPGAQRAGDLLAGNVTGEPLAVIEGYRKCRRRPFETWGQGYS